MSTAPARAASMSWTRAARSSVGCVFPGHATNLAWGDDDWRSLYVTTYHFVFRTRLENTRRAGLVGGGTQE